jgi:SAM-dependent methyltransferase
VDTILEIGHGFGRWTQFLKDACDSLFLVDLRERCIEACRERFNREPGIKSFVNDGKSLDMIPDNSVDFVFSFDSLGHVESDVIDGYLTQLAGKMKKDAVGFVHHSNIASYRNYFRLVRGVPLIRVLLRSFGFERRLHSVSADEFARLAHDAGLRCIHQECINWASPLLIDCMTTFTPKGSIWDSDNQVVKNPRFMDEARHISRRSCVERPNARCA